MSQNLDSMPQSENEQFEESGASVQERSACMERPKILVVGKEDIFTERVMDYAVSLADRLGYDIVAMNVNTVVGQSGTFLHPFKKHLREEFEVHATQAAGLLREKAVAKGIQFEHVVKFGEVTKAVKQLHHEFEHIELVVTEPESHAEHSDAELAIPVFSIEFS
jgi:2-succinyl-5-enolpyruvyl-6-hydroxy-3-cyclohexene-1-carboxylate synthase